MKVLLGSFLVVSCFMLVKCGFECGIFEFESAISNDKVVSEDWWAMSIHIIHDYYYLYFTNENLIDRNYRLQIASPDFRAWKGYMWAGLTVKAVEGTSYVKQQPHRNWKNYTEPYLPVEKFLIKLFDDYKGFSVNRNDTFAKLTLQSNTNDEMVFTREGKINKRSCPDF